MDQLITVDETGKVLALYDDNLPDLGRCKITRASNVEPSKDGWWTVRFSACKRNGKHAGRYLAGPNMTCASRAHAVYFSCRESALTAEKNFIQERILGRAING